ncbi:MAG: hypothetical protein FGM24_10190, partial [Candidatus Kapabacteria bacterium]|nr:hypothetical protein [Candidatus Kapabacteria bacterium]
MTQRGHTVVATIMVLTGMLFLRIGSAEVQPWDEGLYAMRALAIVEHDAWMDQTPYAVGGLYSSTPPPLTSWAVAASIHALGPSPTSLRLYGVLCSALAMAMLYLVMRRIVTFEHAMLAVVVLASALPWWWYARQAMTEVPLMAFTLTALWAAIKLQEGWKWGAMVFAAAFGSALLTKMAVSLLPILFIIPVALHHRRNFVMVMLCLVGLVGGIAMAAPWYMHMAATYGNDFLLALTVPQARDVVEGNAGRIGPLYYANQLPVAHALTAVALIYVAAAVVHRRLLPERRQVAALLSVGWYVLAMLLFSVSATKNPHYVVMLLPPAVITAVYGLERLLMHATRRTMVAVYGIVLATSVWSLLPELRASLRYVFVDTWVAAGVGLMVALTALPWLLPRRVVDRASVSLFKPVVYGVCAAMVARLLWMSLQGYPAEIRGGREVARVLLGGSARTFDYVYHRHNGGDAFNPQLDWYLHGWMSGWSVTKSYT